MTCADYTQLVGQVVIAGAAFGAALAVAAWVASWPIRQLDRN